MAVRRGARRAAEHGRREQNRGWGDGPAQAAWQSLLGMHLEAVARSVSLPVLPWASADLVPLPEVPELLVTGGGDRLASSSELTELAERAGTSGELVATGRSEHEPA